MLFLTYKVCFVNSVWDKKSQYLSDLLNKAFKWLCLNIWKVVNDNGYNIGNKDDEG